MPTFLPENMLLFRMRGRFIWYPTARQVCFQKNIIVTIYLLNSSLLGISSHGYVKDILLVSCYNNFMQISE